MQTTEQELPIDIHSNKLLDWLVSRRHCNREWQEGIREIREKINSAIQDMPAVDEIAQLLAGSYINYFHCLRIVELLKETESGSKNIFGHYSSQRMKDWLEIMKLYEKDNVYLAEAASMLVRNVNYEIPSLKKQIAKCQQVQEECTRREADLQRNANDVKDQYSAKCKQMGIEGKNIKSELLKQVLELPSIFEKIVASVKNLHDCCQYYEAFAKFTVGKVVSPFLPLIHFIMESGNATTYQWRTGQKPKSIVEPPPVITVEDENSDNNGDTIDFCDDIEVIENPDDIDFGDIEIIQPENGDGIDWESDQNANQINFDIAAQITDALEGEDTGVVQGNDALTILDNMVTRNQFVDELMELEAFLEQRMIEMQSENDMLTSNRFQTAPVILQLQTVATVAAMLSKVKQTLDLINNVKVQSLLLICSSPRYVDRLVDSLQKQLSIADKMLKSQESVAKKHQDTVEEQQKLEPKLELIINRTRELQRQIEEEISVKYKNRPVNIMGGIKTI